jgi:HD-like signal output (HDOD) protein
MMTVSSEASILDRLNTKSVPVLAPGAPYLLQSLTDDSIDFLALAQIIERFPSIAGRLIALANSPWSSPVSTITSLESACSRLGFGVVRSTSIALAVASPFNPNRCPSFNTEYFWASALMTADTASWLAPAASQAYRVEASTVRAAGLLHSLGLLWLVDQLPDLMDKAFALARENHSSSFGAALFELIGFTYAEAGGYLASAWKLPEPLVAAMVHQADPDFRDNHWETANLVGLATAMVSAVQTGAPWTNSDIRLGRLGITPTAAEKIFYQLSQQCEKMRDLARTLFKPAL